MGNKKMEKSLSIRQSFVIITILAALWLLKHPYNGIWHDGVIYTFMALKDLYPENFAGDLFIKYGSQDNYTLFPQLYAELIKYFGIYKSALMLTLSGQFLWIFAAVLLFKQFLKSKELYIALALLFFMKSYYGGFNVFQYAEPFVNPRIFSEAFSILCFSFIIKKRHIVAAALFVVSFLINPLMALGAGFVIYIFLILSYPRLLLIVPLLILAFFVLYFFKIDPFSRLPYFISDEWYAIIHDRFFYLFSIEWPVKYWTELFLTLAITFTAYLFSHDLLRRLLGASLIGAVSGMLISIIGGEILRNEFVFQVQTWRVLWFLQFISSLAAALIISKFLTMKENKLLMCTFFLLTWYSTSLGSISFVVTLLFGLLCFKISKNDLTTITIIRPLAVLIIVILIIVSVLMPDIIGMVKMLKMSDYNLKLLSMFADYAVLNLLNPLLLLLIIAFIYYVIKREPDIKIYALSILIMSVSISAWDRQSEWSKMLEHNEDQAAFFQNILPLNATILWDAASEISWIGAKRPSYISTQQGCGAIYNRDTALEYSRRLNIVLPLIKSDSQSKKSGFILDEGFDEIKFKANYISVCKTAQGLDYIVSTVNIPGKSVAKWRSTVPLTMIKQNIKKGIFEEIKHSDFYLYDCGKNKKIQKVNFINDHEHIKENI